MQFFFEDCSVGDIWKQKGTDSSLQKLRTVALRVTPERLGLPIWKLPTKSILV